MKFTFNDKKARATDELREYAEKKISKIDRLLRAESDAVVTFSTERGRYKVELTINNDGTFFRVADTTSDMYASIDSAVAALERQIRKNKTRLEKRIRKGSLEREKEPVIVGDLDDAYDDAEHEFKIVRTKNFPIKPMSPEEAILQMNLLNHGFFVFKNQQQADAFSIVYKRKQGDYGLIETT